MIFLLFFFPGMFPSPTTFNSIFIGNLVFDALSQFGVDFV